MSVFPVATACAACNRNRHIQGERRDGLSWERTGKHLYAVKYPQNVRREARSSDDDWRRMTMRCAMLVVRALLIATLLVVVALLAVAWRDGRADYQCGCSCDRHGNQIPVNVYNARKRDDDDKPPLVQSALFTAVLGTAASLLGVIFSARRRRFFAPMFAAGVVLVLASWVSIGELTPCLNY
jgi:hypothetical protein